MANAKVIVSPSALLLVPQWNRYKDWGKIVAMMGWFKFFVNENFQRFFILFLLPPKFQV